MSTTAFASAKGAVCLALVSLLAACAASGPLYQAAPAPPEGKALIYIYRSSGFAFGARSASFFVDDVKIADLSNNGYTWAYVPQGNHVLREDFGIEDIGVDKVVQLEADWEPGHIYYYRLATHFSYNKMAWEIAPVDPSQARQEIATYRYQSASKASF